MKRMSPPSGSALVTGRYLEDLVRVYRSGAGVPETSYYGALERLLNAVGETTTPNITAVLHPGDVGAGIPDGGLFAAHQLRRAGGATAAFQRTLPTHGVVEAKGLEADLDRIAGTRQVRNYLGRYGKVLLTNYWQFALWVQEPDGPRRAETFQLAGSVDELWQVLEADQAALDQDFKAYLKRALLRGAPISRPEDLAFFLASYARQALDRVGAGDLAALEPLRHALDEALGVTFEGEENARFFRSTLVQTLFYGVFSAWVVWSSSNPEPDRRFDWRTASWFLNVPVVRALFDQVANASRLRPLQLDEVLDWAGDALARVDRTAFFRTFEADEAVQYFYEPFLAAFDPRLRRDLGIWYTPPEVVRYMVGQVDQALRDDFGCASGLADERVYVLDPCVGTGSFIVEVLRRIYATRREEAGEALAARDVRDAAASRTIGFELLPAPFVVAHLQIGLLLKGIGAPLQPDANQRAAIYLTNALTGWSGDDAEDQLGFPELAAERDAADAVKQEAPILVVLGNPPYNAYAGVSPAEEGDLVEIYKKGLSAWGITRNNIDDLYVRFMRVAERRITETQGSGIVSLISNFSYLGDPSLVLLRQRLLAEFDELRIDNLNGDSRETGKRTPTGAPDPSVFSTPRNRAGISQGTAIGTFIRRPERAEAPTVRYRDFWGVNKREVLAAGGGDDYDVLLPAEDTGFVFRRQTLHPDYMTWARVDELCETSPMLGLLEKRRGALISETRDELDARMRRYFDPAVPLRELGDALRGLANPAARFSDPAGLRSTLQAGGFKPELIKHYMVRPFDQRWAYLETRRPLWNEPRPELQAVSAENATFFMARRRVPRADDGAAFAFSDGVGDEHALHKDAYFIPTRLGVRRASSASADGQDSLFDAVDEGEGDRANLSSTARTWLSTMTTRSPDANRDLGESPWLHALAIGYSERYLAENSGGGRFHFQRIPLPTRLTDLERGRELGGRVAALLDTETPLSAVDSGFTAAVRDIGVLQAVAGGSLDDAQLAVQGWAIVQADRVMPRDGTVIVRPWTPAELDALHAAAAALGVDAAAAVERLGLACDIHMNEEAVWSGVPERAWDYKIGGYTVLRKWLSYRDYRVLGRPLRSREASHVSDVAKRLTLLCMLSALLDEHYETVRDSAFEWRTAPARPSSVTAE